MFALALVLDVLEMIGYLDQNRGALLFPALQASCIASLFSSDIIAFDDGLRMEVGEAVELEVCDGKCRARELSGT